MKVLVLNGSPKGKNSITLQTSLFIQKIFSDDTFEFVHVGQTIKHLEKNMVEVINKIETSDLILFSYPVYTFIVPSQLQRFIELIKENNINLKDKYVTQISTSLHFYDVTAHKYIEENVLDLKMRYIRGLSADMSDLLKEKGQNDAINFWKFVRNSVLNNLYVQKNSYSTEAIKSTYIQNLKMVEKSDKHTICVVTNCKKDETNLTNMINDFCNAMPYKTKLINICDFPFSGGCLGCFHCAATGVCIYKDGFDKFLREQIQSCSAIVYAFTIKDHSMGADFKMYDDRQFCNGHRTVTMGMPYGYIISGEYAKENNLKMIIEARSEVGGNLLTGVATDENDTSNEILKLVKQLTYALDNKLTLPANFYGVGGMKIFRDLIYVMRGLMKEDHRFYKKHKIYDFPQKQKGTIIKMKLVGALISIPSVQKKMGNKMTEAIIGPYKKVLNNYNK